MGCDVWQMECQASNITANVQSDHLLHGYMLPVFFTTDQLGATENAGVGNAGVDNRCGKCRSKPYGMPARDYIEKALSYFVILVLILLTE